jgi:D-alanine transaminase
MWLMEPYQESIMPDIGFLNGRFMPLNDVTISVEDRGFQFGDGVYEVIRTYSGMPFQLEAHVERLQRSARAIELDIPDQKEWIEWVAQGVGRAGYGECKVYLQVTRGHAPRDHAFPKNIPPTIMMSVREMRPLDAAISRSGIAAITMEDLRWGRCDIKSINLLPNVLARQRAVEAGAFEAVLVRQGIVTEGSVSNVMIVRGARVVTAPEGSQILSGVTRRMVLDLATANGIAVEERAFSRDELLQAEEVFLTGTTVEVLPVVRVDGAPVGHGRPGSMTERLSALFKGAVA